MAVIAGPLVWLADLVGVRSSRFPVRDAFVLMLGGFIAADLVASAHLLFVSKLPRRHKWRVFNVINSKFAMWKAFEYLANPGETSRKWLTR